MIDNTESLPDTQHVTDLLCGSQEIQDQAVLESRHASKFLSQLRQFRDEKILCDVALHISETKLYVHKTVLAAWSTKFSSVILSPGPYMPELIIGFDDVETFHNFVEFLYTGSIIPTEDNVHSLLDIGKNFHVDSLISLCEDFLNITITVENFVSRYFSSQKYDLTKLLESVAGFVESNIFSVSNEISLLSLPVGKFKKFLSCCNMNGMSQEGMLSLIINWVGFMLPERENLLLYFLSNISWTHSVSDVLMQISNDENIFTSSEFCLFQLLHSIVSKVDCDLGPYTATYPHLCFLFSSHLNELMHPSVSEMDEVKDTVITIPVSVKHESQHHSEQVVDSFEVNMDNHHTSFGDVQKRKQIMDEAIPVEDEVVDSGVETPHDLHETHCDMNDDQEVADTEYEKEVFISKHRRKNIPKKISINGEQRKRRGRGRPKKRNRLDRTKTDVNESNEFIHKNETKDPEWDNEDEYNAFQEIKIEVEDCTQNFSHEKSNTDSGIPDPSVDVIKNEYDVGKSRKRKITQRLSSILPKSISNNSKTEKRISNQNQACKQKQKQGSESAKDIPQFSCPYENCDFGASHKDKLDMHVECVHVLNVTLTCQYCEYTTALMGDMCIHMKTHFTTLPYACDIDGCKLVFQRIRHLIHHQMNHRNEKPYQCDVCSKTFCTYNQFSCHKKLHKDRQFECDVCHQRFTTKFHMQQHRGTHFSYKPYLCDMCGFATRHISHLSLHRKTHSDDLIRCSFTGCSYSTPKRSHMTHHMNAHLNIRNHVCQVCGKAFLRRDKLLRHERIHLKEKLFKCKQCEYRTSRTDRMKLHLEQHGIKIPKRKYNLPLVEEQDQVFEVDFSHLYERVQPSSSPTGTASDSAPPPPSELASNLNQKMASSMNGQ